MVIATITMETVIKVINVLAHSNHYHGKHFQGNLYFGPQKPKTLLWQNTNYLRNGFHI